MSDNTEYLKAKLQIVENDYKKCAEQRDEYKYQLNAADKMIETLRENIKVYKNVIDNLKNEKTALTQFLNEKFGDVNDDVANAANKEIEDLKNKLRDYQDTSS